MMNVKKLAVGYLVIIAPILFAYLFTVGVTVASSSPLPDLHAAVPVFVDLMKVIVGAAIGAFSVSIGQTKRAAKQDLGE